MRSDMIRDGYLLIQNNRAILSGKLKFGDEKQIAALRFLNAVAEYREHYSDCDSCQRNGLCASFDVTDEVYAAARAEDAASRPW